MLAPIVSGPLAPQSRRSFLSRLVSLVAAGVLPGNVLPAGVAHADSPPVGATEVQLAALGEAIRRADPERSRALERGAREELGLASGRAVDLPHLRGAQTRLLERARVESEWQRHETVFAEGWLLARSEAMVALLYASAVADVQRDAP